MSATQYAYDDLKKDTSIRLLKIEPMTHSTCSKATIQNPCSDFRHGRVSCTLETFDDNIPQYSALSSCWGDTEHDRQLIYLGNTLIDVHKNLWEFLDQMQRSGQTETWFWTDFLCLNQGNDDEKGKQIPHMGDIYAKAEETISWLGCKDPSANQHDPNLGDSLKLIAKRVAETREGIEKFFKKLPNWTTIMRNKTYELWPRARWQREQQSDKTLEELEELDELEKQICRLGYGPLGMALNDILLLPYWTRVWIVQEVAMGNRVKLAYGPVSIDLDDFFLAYKCRLYHLMKSDMGVRIVPLGTSVAIQARATRLDDDISMHQILQWGMLCESTLTHDRIYGLLGLLRSYNPRESSTLGSLKVDYKRSITSVFWDVVFAYRTPVEEEAANPHVQQFSEIAAFFPRLANSLGCSLSSQDLLSYLDNEGDLSLNKEMTKRMISIFRSIGSGIFLSTSRHIYSGSTRPPSDLLTVLRLRPTPDPDPNSKFQSLGSDLATIFLECVDTGVDKSAEIYAALVALRFAQYNDLGLGDWSCVLAQDKPGNDDKSAGKRKILERQVRWIRSVPAPRPLSFRSLLSFFARFIPAPSPGGATRCSLAKHGNHRCHGSSLYLNLPDAGWNLKLDIQDDVKDKHWIHGKLSIILNSTFNQPKYGHLIFKD